MNRDTIEVYEASAAEWLARRSPLHLDAAAAFGSAVGQGPSADLGCGPGFYTGVLAPPVIALDAARAMLDRVPDRAPAALRVQADLEALPFRRGGLRAAWARNTYVHLPRAAIPLALAQLQQSLAVDAPAALTFFGGAGEGVGLFPTDDLPGRVFSLWEPADLADVVVGAGFTLDRLVEHHDPKGRDLEVRAVRARTLPDFVRPGLRILLCGLNPSLYAADAGVGFARPGNRFWPAAVEAGVVSRPRDPWHAVAVDGVGMTDLVKRATVAAAEVTAEEYRAGLARVERLVSWLQPAAVCFIGLAGWRAAVDRNAVAGPQGSIGGRPAYLMPNPSGLNAHSRPADFVVHLRAAAALADRG
jgi:TDG/mug DNA glycosylase family protein